MRVHGGWELEGAASLWKMLIDIESEHGPDVMSRRVMGWWWLVFRMIRYNNENGYHS
jgi:hypothetical protein